MNSRHLHRRRVAFSLLEVIIATGILSASAILLLSLFSTGDRMSRRAERRVRAQMHCQAQLSQLLANPQGARVVDGEPIDGFPNWIWSLQLQPTPFAGLVAATVRVSELPAGADDGSLAQNMTVDTSQLLERPDFELTRWISLELSDDYAGQAGSLNESGSLSEPGSSIFGAAP